MLRSQYELNKVDWERFYKRIKEIQAREESEKYCIILKNKDRSYNQLKLYWGEWLPAILYFLKDDIKLNTVEELHIYLKEFFCYRQDKTNYFKEVSIMGKKRYICVFSIDFERCKQEMFNDYMEFVAENFFELVSLNVPTLEDLLLEFHKSVNVIK